MEHSFLINYLIATSNNIHDSACIALFASCIWTVIVFINNNFEPDNEPKSYKASAIGCIISAILLSVVPTVSALEKETPQKLQIETRCR